jgi:hypothetical protein
MLNANWIKVKSNSEVPIGLWLVITKAKEHQVFNNSATSHKLKTIGHYFDSDEEVTMYWNYPLPLALPPEDTTE